MTIINKNATGDIVLYQAPDGTVELDVRLERESLWLNQKQMSLLFDKDTDTIGLHLRNIFKEGELEESATTEESSVVQIEGSRRVNRKVRLYNLDAILSVGYRVNSKRGTQFRIWATRVLRDHIIKGYTVNQNRLQELNQAVRLIANMVDRRDLSGDEAKALLRVVGEYSYALDLLDDYDHQRVKAPDTSSTVVHMLSYEEALRLIVMLRDRFGGSPLFGAEKDKGMAGAWGRSCKPSMARMAIRVLKKKPPTCFTFSSRITPLLMETSASPPHCFSGFWSETAV